MLTPNQLRRIAMPLVMLSVSLSISTSTASAKQVFAYTLNDGSTLLTSTQSRKYGKPKKVYKFKVINRPKEVNNAYKGGQSFSGKTTASYCRNKKMMQKNSVAFKPVIRRYAKKYGVDQHLVHALIKQESCFNTSAKSRVGAMGLMQLMPATAKWLGVKQPWKPEHNIKGGVKYLSQLLDQFNGDTVIALAAYNAGPGNVMKYNGIPPFRETKNYVRKVMGNYKKLKRDGLPGGVAEIYYAKVSYKKPSTD